MMTEWASTNNALNISSYRDENCVTYEFETTINAPTKLIKELSRRCPGVQIKLDSIFDDFTACQYYYIDGDLEYQEWYEVENFDGE